MAKLRTVPLILLKKNVWIWPDKCWHLARQRHIAEVSCRPMHALPNRSLALATLSTLFKIQILCLEHKPTVVSTWFEIQNYNIQFDTTSICWRKCCYLTRINEKKLILDYAKQGSYVSLFNITVAFLVNNTYCRKELVVMLSTLSVSI